MHRIIPVRITSLENGNISFNAIIGTDPTPSIFLKPYDVAMANEHLDELPPTGLENDETILRIVAQGEYSCIEASKLAWAMAVLIRLCSTFETAETAPRCMLRLHLPECMQAYRPLDIMEMPETETRVLFLIEESFKDHEVYLQATENHFIGGLYVAAPAVLSTDIFGNTDHAVAVVPQVRETAIDGFLPLSGEYERPYKVLARSSERNSFDELASHFRLSDATKDIIVTYNDFGQSAATAFPGKTTVSLVERSDRPVYSNDIVVDTSSNVSIPNALEDAGVEPARVAAFLFMHTTIDYKKPYDPEVAATTLHNIARDLHENLQYARVPKFFWHASYGALTQHVEATFLSPTASLIFPCYISMMGGGLRTMPATERDAITRSVLESIDPSGPCYPNESVGLTAQAFKTNFRRILYDQRATAFGPRMNLDDYVSELSNTTVVRFKDRVVADLEYYPAPARGLLREKDIGMISARYSSLLAFCKPYTSAYVFLSGETTPTTTDGTQVKFFRTPTSAKHVLGRALATHESGRIVPYQALWALLDDDVFANTHRLMRCMREVVHHPWHAFELQEWLLFCGTLNEKSLQFAVKREASTIFNAGFDRHGPPSTPRYSNWRNDWLEAASTLTPIMWPASFKATYDAISAQRTETRRSGGAVQRGGSGQGSTKAHEKSESSSLPEPGVGPVHYKTGKPISSGETVGRGRATTRRITPSHKQSIRGKDRALGEQAQP